MSSAALILGARRRRLNPPYNAAAPLATPTPDGTGIGLHADVIDFMQEWNGWRYWMVFTPLRTEADENPCILVSADGLTWQVPAGLTNPIDPRPPTGYNSDASLAYDEASDALYCIWREYPDDANEIIWVSHSSDGITWANPVTVATGVGTNTMMLAPTILRVGSEWRIFVKRGIADNGVGVYTVNSLTDSWGTPSTFTLPGAVVAHFDIAKAGDTYYLAGHTPASPNQIKAWTSTNLSAWTEGPVVLDAATSAYVWDRSTLYRPALVPDGNVMRVWYSGQSAAGWRIGHTRIPLAAFTATQVPG